ncbi:Fic family protein [Pedobacter sp. BS3]|uniref:Fic family protein n=1 Tax=Pedobacter sp. BS3 TaxID=2567937 RepID=UPI0011EE86C7|nr:Fic family protein [Pedobacter sp. BS3]TZF84559.1 Fic family protein [Pedobacter sp. BS3]
MKRFDLHIIPLDLLEVYKETVGKTTRQTFENLHDSELSIQTFSFYTSVSAVFSSKIEGESIELDSFIKHKRFGVKYRPDYTRKIDDLYNAYVFAQQNKLTPATLAKAHALLTLHILQKSQQGKFRQGNMFVATDDGKIEYIAPPPELVNTEMQKLYTDISTLLLNDLTFEEVLFFASLLHLVFVKIHPFEDGNGRMARLLEKWFITQKSGENAWFIQSEKYYYDQHAAYYANIRRLGIEYNELNYGEALPFLNMLPDSLLSK